MSFVERLGFYEAKERGGQNSSYFDGHNHRRGISGCKGQNNLKIGSLLLFQLMNDRSGIEDRSMVCSDITNSEAKEHFSTPSFQYCIQFKNRNIIEHRRKFVITLKNT